MSPAYCLTLLSDFGLADGYVGVMKGVIAGINPDLKVIDLTHQVPPQNIAHGRFVLMTAVPYFPPGTVHVAVVDPGVGGKRRAIAISIGQDVSHPLGFLVAPDNGLLSGVFCQESILSAVELTHAQYWRTPDPSLTFHGRDIFAAVGAHLASGVPLAEVGTPIDPKSLVRLDLPPVETVVEQGYTVLKGWVQAIDHFGNVITTIAAGEIQGKSWSIRVNGLEIPGTTTYSDLAPNTLLALVGSHGWVEIAVNGGNAQTRLGLHWGGKVEVMFLTGDL